MKHRASSYDTPGPNPVRLEAGYGHVLAYCRDCPPWRRLELSHADALEAAAKHMQLTHGQARLAADMRGRAARMRAATRRADNESG